MPLPLSKSTQWRLTLTQRYIFEAILALFGKDIASNIFLLLTFADGDDEEGPPVLAGIRDANVPFQSYFIFNNSLDKTNIFVDDFWQISAQSCKNFLIAVNKVESRSLTLTKEVLNERKQLKKALWTIQQNILLGSNELVKLEQEQKALNKFKQEINDKRYFTFETVEMYPEAEDTLPGYIAINCNNCNVTCFEVPLKGGGTGENCIAD